MQQLDKQAHFLAGLAIIHSVALFVDWRTGLVVAFAAGVGKEIVDYFRYGKPDRWDALATWLGGIAGAVLHLIKG